MNQRTLVIDGVTIADDAPCYVIAEIGHNHQGDLEKAKQLFREAKTAGATAVKLQKRDNRSLYTKEMYDKPYEHEHSFGQTYGEHREVLELGLAAYRELQRYARDLGITMLATAFDFASADFLAELDVPAFKMASGDLKNIPLLTYVARFVKPMIVSTGGGTMNDVRRAYDAIMPLNSQLALLQCTATYPTAFNELDLGVIGTFREAFPNTVIGLSAHDNGIAMALVGYVLGARIIEKHFTLNRAMRGTDHAFSLEPIGLRKLVRDLTRARDAMVESTKRVHPSEISGITKMSKKLVATRFIPEGHIMTEADIALKSPGDGLPPYELPNVLGRVALHPLQPDETIRLEVLGDRQQ